MATLDFERELNADQLPAVTHGEGPQLVLAGAGSGKTRVITYRIAWLVTERGVAPDEITAVTFTNKAASEMKERVERLLGVYPLRSFVGTFHRFALRLLRMYGKRVGLAPGFVIFDSSDQLALVKKAMKAEDLSPDAFRPQAVLAAISSAKNRLLEPAAYERRSEDFFQRRVAPAYRRYQALLRDAGAIDFDDMLALSVKLLRVHPEVRQRVRRRARHLLVDEFQDTNHAQLALIHELAGEAGNLTAVGDEDQGIYRWRGAELDNILGFEKRFPGAAIRKLERNYRSTQNILDAAGAVVAHNENRRGKHLWTDIGEGETLRLYRGQDELDEARWVVHTLKALESSFSLADMAILVRTNAQTRSLEDALLHQQVPYALVGGVRFYERAEIKDLIAYLRLVRNPHDAYSLSRVINQPPRGIGKSTREQLLARAEKVDKTVWQVLEDEDFGRIPERGARALRRFRDLLRPLVDEAETLLLSTLLEHILETTGYADLYDKPDDESRGRFENIQELVSAVREFTEGQAYGSEEDDLLTAFLDHVSLVSDTDALGGKKGLSLMTLHSAKGLEFAAVVIAGLEEKLLPHFNSQNHPDDLEEERRLLYVGMTRAEKRLFLTTCRRRRIAGTYQNQEESRFLTEIPDRFLDVESSPNLFVERPRSAYRRDQASNVYSFFGRSEPTAAPEEGFGRSVVAEPVEEISSQGARIRRGSRVRHSKLGQGRILGIEGSGEDMRLIVYFDGRGRKKLIAKYANLEVI